MKDNVKMMALAALFAALTAVGAFIQIPLGFTSITLQVFFTCMAGAFLGPVWGPVSQIVYVLLGLFGLPVFTQGGGFGYLLKPSMGFLFGLIPMALVVGLLTRNAWEKKHCLVRVFLAFLAGDAVLYAVGLPYMGAILNLYLGKGYSLAQLMSFGCLVYLPGDLIKMVVATALYQPLTRALRAARVTVN